MKHIGFSITLIPTSWAVGTWTIREKTIFAFGPLRFSIHRNLLGWKVPAPFKQGDIVVLNSGGPDMIVLDVFPNSLRTVWKDEADGVSIGAFRFETVKRIG